MKRKKLIIWTCLLTWISCALPRAPLADGQSVLSGNLAIDYAPSARSKALANSTVASARGIDSLLVNPSGLAFSNLYELGMLYVNLSENTTYHFLGYIHPLINRGRIGFGWAGLTSQGFELRDELNLPQGSFNDSQQAVYVGYGDRLWEKLFIGAGLKVYYHAMHQYQNVGVGLDLGMQYAFGDNLLAGITLHNPLSIPLQSEEMLEPLPFLIQLGGTWHPNTTQSWLDALQVSLQLDLQDIYATQGGLISHLSNSWKIGLEYAVAERFFLRTGMKNDNFSFGAGVVWQPFSLDYAYDVHTLKHLHWISLNATLGASIDQARVNETYQNAITAYQKGDYAQAAAAWKKMLHISPTNEAGKKYLEIVEQKIEKQKQELTLEAETALSHEDYPKAVEIYEQILKLEPGYPLAQNKLISIQLIIEKKNQEAREAEITSRIQNAETYYRQGNIAKALAEWEKIVMANPNHPEAVSRVQALKAEIAMHMDDYFKLGQNYFDQKNYARAAEYFQMILNTKPDFQLAIFYFNQSRDRLSEQLNDQYRQGIQLFQQRRYAKAVKRFEEILAIADPYKNAATYLGAALKKLQGLTESRGILQKARRFYRDQRPAEASALLKPLIDQGIFDHELSSFYNQLIQTNLEAGRLYQEGISFHRAGEMEKSIKTFTRCLALDRQSPARNLLIEIHSILGIQAYRNDHLLEALSHWKKVLSYDSDHIMVKKYISRATNKIEFLKKTFGNDYFHD